MEPPSNSKNSAPVPGSPPAPELDRAAIEPRLPRSNPNVSKSNPLVELARSGAIVLGILLVLYLVLGWTAGWLATRVPDSVEARWGDAMASVWSESSPSPEQERLQELVDRLALHLPPRDFPYTVHYLDVDVANAMALPGGHILVFGGLLEEVESENELALILGHELAHQDQRHHLKNMGRSLAFALALTVVIGNESLVKSSLEASWITARNSFSRRDELESDRIGLELLHATYGHVGGATDFYERHIDENDSEFWVLFQTHPLSRDRIDRINELAQEHGYPVRETVPWTP